MYGDKDIFPFGLIQSNDTQRLCPIAMVQSGLLDSILILHQWNSSTSSIWSKKRSYSGYVVVVLVVVVLVVSSGVVV